MDRQKAEKIAQALIPINEKLNEALAQIVGEPMAFALVVFGTASEKFPGVVSNLSTEQALHLVEDAIGAIRGMQAQAEAAHAVKH